MKVDRRDILRAGVSASVWTAFGAAGSAQPVGRRLTADGQQILEAGPAKADILGIAAPAGGALGYEGATPGPLLRLTQGEALKIRLANSLSEPTTLCWQGLRGPNAMAGVGALTQPAAPPGANFDYRFTPPDAGFNLYAPHAGAATPGQISRGLYGPIIVDESAPPARDLEVVVVLAERSLDAQGRIRGDLPAPEAQIAVNGGAAPLALQAPPGARVRLRLANAAGARILAIGVEGVKPLIIALDGQPCEAFAPLNNVFPVGPGARFDMMFDMPRDGTPARLLLLGGGESSPVPAASRALVVLSAVGASIGARPPLAGLEPNRLLPRAIDLGRATRIDIAIAGGGGGGGSAPFSINGATLFDWPARPLFAVARGAPVTLGLANKTSVIQAIRLHGHCMRLLHPLDDGWEPYWRDSVLIAPGRTSHVAFVADNPGRWPIESAIPEHRAAGVMTMFEVE